jgi:hypothetical protein
VQEVVMVVRRVGIPVFALVAGLSCGGGSSPTPTGPNTQPNGVPTTAPTAVPTATPSTPVGAQSCPYGKGSLDAQCGPTRSMYVGDIDRAITEVTRRRPELFNLSEEIGTGNYRVVNTAEYFTAVVQQLQGMGFCAESDGFQSVQLKKGNDFSEKYAILTSGGFIRRGEGSYRDSCHPAVFPVDDVDRIDAVRVHFFSIRCPEGIAAPDNAEKKLPVGCTGWVSATPKDKANKDVPPAIHGTQIVWEIFQGEGENLARVTDAPGQPFNKYVDALNAGYFTMCATVLTVRGCFGFDIYHP